MAIEVITSANETVEVQVNVPDAIAAEVDTVALLGPKGDPGNGIVNITGPVTVGLVDTYTVHFTNGNSTTFDVTNGSSISSISKTSTSGLVDTYTVTLTNGDTDTFTVTNGKDGIDGEDGTDGFSPIATVTQTASGAIISITDAEGTTTADITNGTDGTNATITGATASVDNNTGTPSVTVTTGGTSSARSFDFAFSNLKGSKGDTGNTGATGPSGVAVSTTEPTNPDVLVWLNPNGTSDRYLIEASDPSLMPSWYRVYSDGWCEQGGNAYGADIEIQLLKQYSSAYSAFACYDAPSTAGTATRYTIGVSQSSSSAFTIMCGVSGMSAYVSWVTYGYIDLSQLEESEEE